MSAIPTTGYILIVCMVCSATKYFLCITIKSQTYYIFKAYTQTIEINPGCRHPKRPEFGYNID